MNEYNRNMRVEINVIENKERNIGCAEQRTAEQNATQCVAMALRV